MKALSIRAPWHWFIVSGPKRIENRKWATFHRGPVMIHASKWWVESEVRADFEVAADLAHRSGVLLPPVTLQGLRAMGGHIVGRAVMTDCLSASSSPWFFGPYGFVLDQVQPVARPIPCKGALGLFDVSEVLRGAPRL